MSVQIEGRTYHDLNELASTWQRHPVTLVKWIVRGIATPAGGPPIQVKGAIRSTSRWLVPAGAIERFMEELSAARMGATSTTAAAKVGGA